MTPRIYNIYGNERTARFITQPFPALITNMLLRSRGPRYYVLKRF